jgi:hypothetical protein
METRPIFVLLVLLLAAGAFAQAYTWTDENGIVHYSDRPHPGAETIEIGGYSTRTRPEPTASAPARRDSGSAPALRPNYTSIEIIAPGAEETLWNIETILNVDLELTPALMPGHQVRVYYDGMPQMFDSASFQLEEVYRGVHNLQVEVIDSAGKLLIRSRPNRFYVQQNSVN